MSCFFFFKGIIVLVGFWKEGLIIIILMWCCWIVCFSVLRLIFFFVMGILNKCILVVWKIGKV